MTQFRSLNKNLRLIVEAPYREPFANGMWKDHLGKWIQFKNGWYQTEDEQEIAWLKDHRLFSEVEDMPGKFWIYIAPPDPTKIIAEREAEIARLKEENDVLKQAKDVKRIRLKEEPSEQVAA